jgi:methyl farnesoate epoxidase/farnesoate epoxidase
MVLLSGYEVIKEAFEKPEFAGRPSIGPFLVLAGKEKWGLVVSEGQNWAEQRRFALRHLRDFGFGKKSMEGAILENASDFINVLKSKKGSPISTERMLSLVVLSALWEIIAGEKLAIDDPRAQDALNRISRYAQKSF